MRRHRLIALLLIIATLAVYWPVYFYDFVQFDDNIHVYENPYLNPVTPRNILHFWQKPYKRDYRPLTYSLWGLAATLSQTITAGTPGAGLDPRIFHTVNLILHLLSVLVVFAILRVLVRYASREREGEDATRSGARGDWAAGLGALLFALHPLQVQAVAWVTGMKDLLSGILALVAVWQYVAWRAAMAAPGGVAADGRGEPCPKRRARLHYTVASIAFVLALFAKQSSAAVPLALWIIDYCVFKRSLRKSAAALLWWLAAAGLMGLAAKMQQPDTSVVFATPLWGRFFVAGDAVAFYLYKLVLPLRLGFDYGRTPGFVLAHGWGYLAWLLPCGLAVLLWFQKDRRLWLAAMGVFIAGILPVSGLIPAAFQDLSTVQDHYLYFAMLGPAMALAWLLSGSRRLATTLLCVLLLELLAIRSTSQSLTWRDNITMLEHTLKVNPESWFARTTLGIALMQQGDLDEAIAHYYEALRIEPGFALAHYNLGLALAEQQRYEKAIYHYRQALRITPGFARARKHLQRALRRKRGEK